MKIKEQTRKLAAGCSKYCFEVADRTDEVSNHTYGKVKLTWFEFDFRRVLNRKQVIQVFSQGWVSEDLFCKVSVRNLVVHSNSDDVDDFLRTF